MKLRAQAIAAMALPLLVGFSCTSSRWLTVSGPGLNSSTAEQGYSAEAVASDFAKVTAAIDGWRSSFGFLAAEFDSRGSGRTPFCKRYETTDVTVDVRFSVYDNFISVVVYDSGRGKRGEEIEKSLRATLEQSFGASSVKDRYGGK
jgi:hypothetical protein